MQPLPAPPQERTHGMGWLLTHRAMWLRVLGERVHGMATFIESHATPRWLAHGSGNSTAGYM